MSNHTLSDLNTSLHEQLQRLSKATGEELKAEIERTRAMSSLASTMVENAKTVLEAHRTVGGKADAPKMLTGGEGE